MLKEIKAENIYIVCGLWEKKRQTESPFVGGRRISSDVQAS